MSSILKIAGAAAAAAAVAAGGVALAGSSSSSASSARSTAAAGPGPGGVARGAAPPQGSSRPQGSARPGLAGPSSGVAAQVERAVLARYPGTVERVQSLPDGTYEAHVLRASGELHVHVSADFKVLGLLTGAGGAPPGGSPGPATPPAGSAPSNPGGSSSGSGSSPDAVTT